MKKGDPVLKKMAKNWASHKGTPLLSENTARSILKSVQFKDSKSTTIKENEK